MKNKFLIVFIIICIFSCLGIYGYLVYTNFKYPFSYKTEIVEYSIKYDISCELVASLINCESGFDKSVMSSKGAIGLMQIMPTTAVEVANKLGIEFEVDDLFDIDTNINIGCYYLKYLLNMFDGNIDNALSAYNWGLSNVKTWILKGNTDGYGNITNIPVRETENYLKKYRRAKIMYTNIFGYDV